MEFRDTEFTQSIWNNLSANSNCCVLKNTGNTSDTDNLDLTLIIPLGVFLGVLSLITFVGNVMVLHAIRTEKKLQTVSNIFIMSLAIADCSVGLFVMPISAVYALLGFWPFGLIVCNVWLSMDYVASTASIFNLFALSLDRFWSIISPLKYLKKRTRKRAFIMCSSVWLASFLWIIPVVGWHRFYKDGRRDLPLNACDTEFADEEIFKVLTATFNFYVPMLAMIALYGRIFHEIKVRAKTFEAAGNAVSRPDDALTSSTKHKRPLADTANNVLHTPDYAVNGTLKAPANEVVQLPQIIVEDADDSPNTRRRRRIIEYDGITLVHLTVSTENIMKEQYEHVDVSVEFDSESDRVETLQLPERSIDDDCISLSEFNEDELDEERVVPAPRPAAAKKRHSKTRFPRLSNRRNSSRKPSVAEPLSGRSETPRLSDTAVHSPSSRKRLTSLLQKQTKPKTAPPKTMQPTNKFKREKKAAFQLGVILGAFCLCFMPYFVSFIISAFCPGCVDQRVHLAFTWLGYLNSTVNPFLYPWTNANFRSSFRKMFCMEEKKPPVINYLLHKMPAVLPSYRRPLNAKKQDGHETVPVQAAGRNCNRRKSDIGI
ncbi:histamine H1 receptor-like [Paramacrobiotus metropolitanus]|uniref:histamine H1 receptor-like n=1 Tax=Paramacrobiotus metropolitanus TaxID=2943436 RepID=UPI002445F459|nr:histamine H1 receptor-like [Paramacrobiotus metropolitanus]XP_055351329.1 histamine H1 receptor-like [Paramacrobiotus metropolitanus]